MKKMKISLGSIEDVKEFVALTNSYSFDSDLVSGRYAVDAKSIMGIFSLDLSKNLTLNIQKEDNVDAVLAAIDEFIVKE